MPQVSVVMACYNHERFIGRAIEAVVRQDMTDWELILVDDGSIDNSLSIAHSFIDSRIKIMTKQNEGPSDAWNDGIEEAKGEYIVLASADDEFEFNLLSRAFEELHKHAADVCFCSPILIDEFGSVINDIERAIFFRTSFKNQSELYFKLFSIGNFLLAPGALIRKSLLIRFGGFRCALYQLQDFDLWVRLAPHCKMIQLPDRLVRYRIMGDGSNLSARRELFYSVAEYRIIYSQFFNNAPRTFVHDAFKHIMEVRLAGDEIDSNIETALLLLTNRKVAVQEIGLERAISFMSDPQHRMRLHDRFGITAPELRRLARGIGGADKLQHELWGRHKINIPIRKKPKNIIHSLVYRLSTLSISSKVRR